MIIQENFNKIKEAIEVFFNKLSFLAQINISQKEENSLSVDVKTDEPQILIGERGETLYEIQHLLKLLVKKITGSKDLIFIDLDINDYKKKKASYLKEMACSVADEVVLTRKEKTLPPMSAYERRIIHSELAGRDNIITESVGEEPERKVVIRPSL